MKKNVLRRNFLFPGLILPVTLLAGITAAGCKFFAAPHKKPNLLFIVTDEQRAGTMAAYGNSRIKTPNLNRLAEESFVFLRAYDTSPICTPARSSFMTGLYPHTNGCTDNSIPLPDSILCFPELLDDPDYKTAYMGKWHLGKETDPQHGFSTWLSIEDIYGTKRSDYHHWLVRNGYHPDREYNNSFSRSFAASLPLEFCKPKFLEEHACEYLEKHKESPFILYVSFLEPHMPFTGPLNDLHPPGEVELPGNFNDPLSEDEPIRYRAQREFSINKYGPGEKEFRDLIARYWGLVSQVDLSVGAILDKLRELGLEENTIVVFTSDHGDMMGSHKMVQKGVMMEEAIRIPWLMRIPYYSKQQTLIDRAVSQIDIVPTLLDLLGKREIPEYLQGKSLLPLLKGRSMREENVFIEWSREPYQGIPVTREEINRAAGQASSRTVVTPDGWKLSLRDTDKSTLYNLKEDPFETTNLFTDARYQDIITQLTEEISNWQKRTEDPWKIIR